MENEEQMGKIKSIAVYCGSSMGKAIGVIPSLLEEREISHKNLTELYKVETMHQRKSKMI